jgi:hypothetical protein
MSDLQIKQLNQRWQALVNERASWISHWEDISDYLLPRSGRFFNQRVNDGDKKHNHIYDNTGTKALRVLAAGMMSGMTSPSRPWFKLSVADNGLMQYEPVKIWLNGVTEQIQDVLARSNAYRVLHHIYEELGAFGTASAFIGHDYENVIHLHAFTAGEYVLAQNWRNEVETLYREFDATVSQLVREFGFDVLPARIQSQFQRGELETLHSIRHAIEPRHDRDFSKKDAKNMPFKSCYWLQGDNQTLLRESGFLSFPCVSPRWATKPCDVYGSSPAMDALGDIKQLQQDQSRKSLAIEYQANPPIQVPSSLKNRESDYLPGGVTYYDPLSAPQGVKNAFDVPLDIRNLLLDVQDIRGRINSAFFADVFMMISSIDSRMTATEVAERHEEKMLMLGPVVERLNNELLDPLVETVFERLLVGGLLPPAPEELQGADLNIEYVSVLAQAQKAAAVNGVDRFVSRLGEIAAIKPDVLDRFNADHWAEMYSDKLGIDPELIVPGEQAALVRQDRAKAMAAQQQQMALTQAAEMASKLGNTPTTPGTVTNELIKRLGMAA